MPEQFLSDAWLDEVAKIRAELGGGASSALGEVQLNLVVTGGPKGDKDLHLAGSAFGKGLLADAPTTLKVDHDVAKALFVDGNREVVVEALKSGKLVIDGDISALLAMRGAFAGGSEAQEEYQQRLRAITEGAPQRSTVFGPMSQELLDLGLASYAEELAEKGLTIVPPEIHGVTSDQFDYMADCILARAEELTGCRFTLEEGPLGKLEFVDADNTRAAFLSKVTQFLVHRTACLDRAFRDLAVNPAQTALMRHLMQGGARFSSFNCFVKWQGEFGMGPGLGLHHDQTGVPGQSLHALNANATWNLTEYTKEDGCLAYVPGSHTMKQPTAPAEAAVPVEAPRGSLIVFHGATIHGAYPKQTPGLRLTLVNYFRHQAILPQEEIKNAFPRELAEDCVDPDLFCELAGFGDIFPYVTQTATSPTPVPQLAR